ncbi:hypothetical protein B0H21DRAFT_739747 [Amylocystis lapponica]|nr:hypothetical protein B0H21DRAFT_739747 [Amylocystis lapponica]
MSPNSKRPDVLEPSSPEDGSNFRRSLQIDMKGLVGDAVGNMSISPGSRDIVLAARRGLFIIDLEAPLNVPRFLPQGGTWDVADVQWNPHSARGEYIVSTSSEKLLIWNLLLAGKTSIEHILRSHYRAITDINWHTTDPDIVVSTGIDSWLWTWDLRTTQKPVMGLSAFNAGGTQVKWNRQDGNILASSHLNEVLIWDRRKGSLPVSRIPAHNAKIYGIDWAHDRRNELVTCSLDKTIKVWDTQKTEQPTITIRTVYPVWRARDLPFGHGVLSLPQRGETTLDMFAHENPHTPIETFEGHIDVVKEFVWRKGGQDSPEFQLITWSKDRTLRFWPVDTEVMQKAGTKPTSSIGEAARQREFKVSFSSPPVGTDLPPALSAPVGHRAILAEVRAPVPPRPSRTNAVPHPTRPASPLFSEEPDRSLSIPRSKPVPIAQERGTMTRGYLGGRSAQITTFAWLSSVKVGGKREGSSGPGSGADSGNVSRINSRSRPTSTPVDRSLSQTFAAIEKHGNSKEKFDDDYREGDAGQSLQDEITSVIGKLTAAKVKLEKADLTKKRTCTFGLHGPWGDSTSVFTRISFTFPRDYPQAGYPSGIPRVDLERNPLISIKNRAFILRRLRTIRERQRPCLEKCLRFLLFGDEEHVGTRRVMDSESSSDDEAPSASRKYRDIASSLLRSNKNLAEPRTSQGVFGVNGELVCFFRAPPRIVRNPMREISVSPSVASRSVDSAPRLFQSPALLSDAVRHLGFAAHDREIEAVEQRRTEDGSNILRIMTNLFTFSQQKPRRISEHSRPLEDIPASYSLLPTRRSTVFLKSTCMLFGVDSSTAREYVIAAPDCAAFCKRNAEIAKARGRHDHERIFSLLNALSASRHKAETDTDELSPSLKNRSVLALHVVDKLYEQLSAAKDIQMLAMLAILLLRAYPLDDRPPISLSSKLSLLPIALNTEKITTPDALRTIRPSLSRQQSLSSIWSRPPSSPTAQPIAPSLSSPSSSRGSWSSLFNTNGMKHLVAGPPGPKDSDAIPVPGTEKMQRGFSSTARSHGDATTPVSPTTKSWSEAANFPSVMSTITFSSAGHPRRRPTFSQVLSAQQPSFSQKTVVSTFVKEQRSPSEALSPQLRSQLLCHVLSYSEMLLAWQLPEQRSELLKIVEREFYRLPLDPSIIEHTLAPDRLGVVRVCGHLPFEAETCPVCTSRSAARCSVCRLPVKGLSHSCLTCLHVTHVACWEARRDGSCASGCGCQCDHSRGLAVSGESITRSLSPLQMWTPSAA